MDKLREIGFTASDLAELFVPKASKRALWKDSLQSLYTPIHPPAATEMQQWVRRRRQKHPDAPIDPWIFNALRSTVHREDSRRPLARDSVDYRKRLFDLFYSAGNGPAWRKRSKHAMCTMRTASTKRSSLEELATWRNRKAGKPQFDRNPSAVTNNHPGEFAAVLRPQLGLP